MLPPYNFLLWKKFVLPGEMDGPPVYYQALYTHAVAAGVIWVFSIILLGLGGLLRERGTGSSSFTLTLPVSRAKLIGVRVAVGVLQAAVLAVAPWLVNIAISMARHAPFSLSQAAWCTLFLAGGGMVCFALAVLISSVVEGEYTAAAVTYGLVILSVVIADKMDWKQMNLVLLITGADYLNHQTHLFSGEFPWLTTVGSLSAAVLMVFASIAITQRKDY
jgi:ABC-type transport system involved in multi-copper enzyme maturation permease subunit